MEYNTIIIGAGISGISAAIYLKRANIDVCILEKSSPGGQLLRTSTIENYPGYKKIDGATLAVNLYEQVINLNIPLEFEEVVEIVKNEKIEVKTKKKNYICKNLIIATGRTYRKLGLENEEKLTSKGISYCATCDGALYKNKNVAVVGAGNSAFEEALYLSNLCNHVTIIARRDEFRATYNLIDEVKLKPNIEILSNEVIEEIIGKEKLEGLRLLNTKTGKKHLLEVEGCFIYIGQDSNINALKNLNLDLENGYILTDDNMQTNVENVYACGDCIKKSLYQLVTASSDGIIAANNIIKKDSV